jgi:hypothetical protein
LTSAWARKPGSLLVSRVCAKARTWKVLRMFSASFPYMGTFFQDTTRLSSSWFTRTRPLELGSRSVKSAEMRGRA